MNIAVSMEFGFVKLWDAQPVWDDKMRVVGWTHRITDSNGRDEALPPAVRIVYND
jgi:hypothetical protein